MESAVLEQQERETDEVRIAMSKETFLNWSPDDGFLYEYDNGFAEQTTGMKRRERYIISNIQAKFLTTKAFGEKAWLFEESDVWVTDSQKRIPDMAFFTREQIADTSETEPIPAFVVELISPSDKADKIERKVIEYFNAGVQAIWHVFPALQMVRVFTTVNSNTTHFETDVFDAGPVVPDLSMTVNELFAR
ncbi:MAG: Uma2 family endonuclease [Spirosoma sp.]|nr:Uma2 family endonuclease [Spirosoma sp.]